MSAWGKGKREATTATGNGATARFGTLCNAGSGNETVTADCRGELAVAPEVRLEGEPFGKPTSMSIHGGEYDPGVVRRQLCARFAEAERA
jgi:hypothetical protein